MNLRNAGFSLIELLVSIAIIGVLTSVAVPSFQTMLENRRLIASTEAVYAQLQFARSEAVKLSRDVPLNISVKATAPWCLGISNSTANCDCNTAAACVYGPTGLTTERNLLGSEYTNIALTTNQTNVLVDSARGGFGVTAGSITLTSSPSNQITKIIFSQLGRVRICTSSNVGGYPSC